MSQHPCLPVPKRRKRTQADIDNDGKNLFDNIESMDAMQYMQAVMHQASSLPDVFVSDTTTTNTKSSRPDHVPIDGSAASLAYLVSDRTAILPPPTTNHLPSNTAKWVNVTLANFSELRLYLESCFDRGVGGKKTQRIPVPPLSDCSGWHVFCVGPHEASGNVGVYFDESSEEETEEQQPAWRTNVPSTGYEPTVALLCQMDQVMVRRVLSHLCYYVQEGWSPCTGQKCAWLYALLARLERPLHRDQAAMLFSLLKELTRARCKLDPLQREKLSRLNVLIVAIGLYFEQGGYDSLMTVKHK